MCGVVWQDNKQDSTEFLLNLFRVESSYGISKDIEGGENGGMQRGSMYGERAKTYGSLYSRMLARALLNRKVDVSP